MFTMPTLTWSPEITLHHPAMDETHQDFVALLAAAEAAQAQSPDAALAAYEALVAHTEAHFDQEDRWMVATGFARENCHSLHHAQVLGLMREVSRLAREQGDHGPLTRVLPELAPWFTGHVQTMDTALATHLHQVGFDPATGTVARALSAATPAQTGCGGATCGTQATPLT